MAKKECDELNELLRVKRPQFVAVYGRRRVGKTYLIKRFFKDSFSFYVTGAKKMTPRERLSAFGRALVEAGYSSGGVPKNWPNAFARLKELLRSDSVYREPSSGKRVVFIDELPLVAEVVHDWGFVTLVSRRVSSDAQMSECGLLVEMNEYFCFFD